MRHLARRSGFTLVELLVAISILAIVAVLGWRGLDSIVRARSSLTTQMEVTRGMQLAFAQLQSDCEHITRPEILNGRPYLLIGNDRITMVRDVFTENQPSRLQVVAYRIVNGTLMRRESNVTRDLAELDALWQASTSDTDTGGAVALQGGVAGMQVLVWQNDGWRQAVATINTVAQSATGVSQEATGLQVALQQQGQEVPLSKFFLVGEP
ncbi:PulJ/GspJ family protein [Massilia phyllosphaerae]|uniref:PulJ/GspJ family protein n=1 Tax=Massilia phyllosphaerae TaxID=3106034 RepID=UPI002B1CDBC9|nr:prepilin-type N-terminal cleavage/methylation domain-containing protein [Massilia sp. SGZ-792]